MTLTHLTDDELLLQTKKAAKNERLATTVLLNHLVEVERRRVYAKKSCSSLYQYCIKELKMSEPQAGRSVGAAKALGDFPEAEKSLRDGGLSLTSLSQVQTFFNQEQKAKAPLPTEKKKEILNQVINQSTRKTEALLLQHSSRPPQKVKDRARRVSQEITDIRFGADEELMKDIQRLREIWSHSLPAGDLAALFKKMAKYCVEKLDPVEKAQRAESKGKRSSKKNQDRGQELISKVEPVVNVTFGKEATPAPELKMQANSLVSGLKGQRITPAPELNRQTTSITGNRSRYIPAKVRHLVWKRDEGKCTFKDPETGEVCGSKHLVQADHRVPFAKGGDHSAENLRLRCFAHNQRHAVECFGQRVLSFGKG